MSSDVDDENAPCWHNMTGWEITGALFAWVFDLTVVAPLYALSFLVMAPFIIALATGILFLIFGGIFVIFMMPPGYFWSLDQILLFVATGMLAVAVHQLLGSIEPTRMENDNRLLLGLIVLVPYFFTARDLGFIDYLLHLV